MTSVGQGAHRGDAQCEDDGGDHKDRKPGGRVDLGEHPEADGRERQSAGHHESRTNPAYDHRGQQGSGYKSAGRGHGPQARHQRREPKHQLQVLSYKEEDPGDNKDAERERCQ